MVPTPVFAKRTQAIRFRDQPRGRRDATKSEARRIGDGNLLMVNFLALLEGVAVRGGIHLMEHPDDPGEEPFPSIWDTEQCRVVERRTGARRCKLHQCPFGARARKPTCLSTNIEGFPELGPQCSGDHQHERGMGRKVGGVFRSQRLASYPPALCRYMAERLVGVFVRWSKSGEGPTGWMPGLVATDNITLWSSAASLPGSHGTAILNETAARHMRTTIDAVSSAFYLHVDDGIFVGTDERMTNKLMHDTADALERVGFEVNDRRESQPVMKLIGYESVRRPPTLRFPLEKGVRLERAMGWFACCQFVFVDAVSSLLAIWIHGALLRRDLLSIGNHFFPG